MDEYMKPTMKVCMNVECAGKEQPHSYDASVKGLDCDGPCSERRVAAWKASRTAKKTEPATPAVRVRTLHIEPHVTGPYDMCGRDVMLVQLQPDERLEPTVPECYDCGAPALTFVIERHAQTFTGGWLWCGICQIG